MRFVMAVLVCSVVNVTLARPGVSNTYGGTGDTDPATAAIFATLRDRLARVHTVRYTAVSRSQLRSRTNPSASVPIENRTETTIKDAKYLVKVKVSNAELPAPKESTQAFDGVEYQLLDEGRATLSSNTTLPPGPVVLPYRVPQPITAMFGFALDRVLFRDYQALKEASLWDQIARKSRVVGHEVISSLPCTVVRVDGIDQGKSATLYLAEGFGFYPMRVDFDTGAHTRVDVVDSFETVADADVSLIIPTKITTTGTTKASGRKSSSSLTIEPGTLAVNVPIRDAIFTLPKNQVPVRIDMAKGLAYKDNELVKERDHLTTLAEPATAKVDSFVLALAIGLIAVGLGLTMMRRLRGRNSVGSETNRIEGPR